MKKSTAILCSIILSLGLAFAGWSQNPPGAYGPGVSTPGGSNGQIQFNNNGVLAGSSVVSTNPGGISLTVAGIIGLTPTASITSPNSGQTVVLQLTGAGGNGQPVLNITNAGTGPGVQSPNYATATNCAVNSVSPAACGSAAAGAFVVPATTTTYTVNTTAITANSLVFLQPRTDTGNLPGAPTCTVPTITADPVRSAIVAGTSFTIAISSSAGQTCWQYWIVD